MLTFLIAVILAYEIGTLIKGNPLADESKETMMYVNKLAMKQSASESDVKGVSEVTAKVVIKLLMIIPILIIKIIVLISAINTDPLKVPTIMMWLWKFSRLFKNKKKYNFDINTPEGLAEANIQLSKTSKKHSLMPTLKSIVNVTFYTYILICINFPDFTQQTISRIFGS